MIRDRYVVDENIFSKFSCVDPGIFVRGGGGGGGV